MARQSSTPPWRNRIVGHGVKPAKEFLANPDNWRLHPQAQADAVQGSIDELGWIDEVMENVQTGHVIDGHERIVLALRKGDDTPVPYTSVDLSPEEEKLALAVFDPITSMAVADKQKLDALLRDVMPQDAALQQMLSELAAREGLYIGNGEPTLDDVPEPQVDRAEELQEHWQTQVGQLWEVVSRTMPGASHRIICADSAQSLTNDLLMNGVHADLGLTSPPYAVGKDYESGVSFTQHLMMLESIADRGLDVIRPGGFFFVNFGEIAAQSHAGPLTGSDRQCLYLISADYWRIFHVERRYDLYAQRIWYKPFNRLQQPFWTYHTSIPHYQEWEHIWTWRLPGGMNDVVYDWDISVRAVWDTRQESTEDRPLTRHVAAFPVGIPERAIKAHSDVGSVVWEPFLGSGTTMVACEWLKRVCYGSERDPKSVAVTLQRLQDMGLTPRLVEP